MRGPESQSLYCNNVQHLPLNSITHRYLESGHSQNENDSIHAVIERSKKGMTVFVPEQYYTLVATARGKPNKPYKVHEVHQGMIFDFKKMSQAIKNFNVDEKNEKVNWLQICEMKFRKINMFKVEIKYTHQPTESVTILDFQRKARGQKELQDLPLLYTHQLPVNKATYQDVLSLVEKNIIPPVYHSYFKNLPKSTESDGENELEDKK